MEHLFEKIAEFNRTFEIRENKKFHSLPSVAESELSYALIKEELEEYREAMRNHDTTEVADALIDMLYLVIGAMRRHGMSAQLATALFNEVHASNMSKVTKDGKIIKRIDGKILKPDTYFAPNIKRILDENN